MPADDLLTLTDLGKLLGISFGAARKLWETKKLAAERVDPKTSRPLFRRADVEEFVRKRGEKYAVVRAASWTVEQCKQAFALFRKKAALPQIVEEVGLTPEQVRLLYAEFVTPLTSAPPVPTEHAIEEEQRRERAVRERARAVAEEQEAAARAARAADDRFQAKLRALEKERETARVEQERANAAREAARTRELASRPTTAELAERLAQIRARNNPAQGR